MRYAPEWDTDQLRTLDLTTRIVQTSYSFSHAGALGDVYKCIYASDGGSIEVCVVRRNLLRYIYPTLGDCEKVQI